MKHVRAAAMILLLAGAPLVAQEPAPGAAAPDTVYPLAPVAVSVARGVFSADRAPFAISVVRAAEVHPAHPGVDLHELLRRVPGVVASNRYSLALDTRIAVRGFGARSAFGVRGVRMLLDGIPLTLPDGQTMLTNVDLGSLESAAVLRGPAAALYGNAAGGVIALTTVEAPPEGLAEATVTAGTYGTRDPLNLVRVQGNVGGAGERESWFVGVSHLTLDGFREHSRAQRTGVNARYRRAFADGSSLTTVVHAAVMPVADNPGSLPLDSARARPRMAWPQNVATGSGKEATQVQGGAAYSRDLGGARIDVAAHAHHRAMDNPLPFGRYIRLGRDGVGARIEARPVTPAAVTWTAGAEAQTQRDDRIERDNVEGVMGGLTFQDRIDRVRAVAPFALLEARPVRGVTLRSAVRYDAVTFDSDDRLAEPLAPDRAARRTLGAWSASGGAVVELGARSRAWASASSWFQTPTTTELINAPPAPGDECCPAGFNPELEPQDGWGWEVGVAGRAGPLAWELVGFDLRVRNEILPFQVEGVEGREFFRNAGRSSHRGVEAAGTVALGAGWDLGATYALSDFRFTAAANPALEGNRLPGVPPHRLDARLHWRGAATSLALEAEWVDRYPADDANTGFVASYAVVDLRAARALEVGATQVEPFAAVTNLLDARYSGSVVVNAFGGRYFEPAPGRALVLGARARFR